jgi:hypothetical protein
MKPNETLAEHRHRGIARGWRLGAWALTVGLLSGAGVARAESRLEAGHGLAAQPAVVRTLAGYPSRPGTWVVGMTGAYGWQSNVLADGNGEAMDDAMHRSWGRLSLAYAPWAFLQVAVSLDQSIGSYLPADSAKSSLVSGAVGDPRLSFRTGWRLGAGFSLGAAVGVLFPSGFGAFDAMGRAISPAVDVAVSYAPDRFPLGVHLQVGYLHNRTGQLIQEIENMAENALALSGVTVSMHHLRLGLAVEYRFGPAAPYVELTGDVPFDHDGVAHTWLLVGFGARFWLAPGDAVQLTVAMEVRAVDGGFGAHSDDPADESDEATVWESPPLVGAMLGLAVRLPIRRERLTTTGAAGEGPVGGAGEGPGERPLASGRIAGRVLCADGPCGRGTVVEVVGTGGSPFAVDPEQGTFTTTELAAGSYSVVAQGEGLEARTEQVEVEAGATAEVSFTLAAAGVATGIRGRVTDFSGAPLRARVRVPALDVEIESDAEGQFEVEAPPGVYQVMIWAQGHQTQTTSVEVTRRGMVVMNVELR